MTTWSIDLLPYALQEVPDAQVFAGGDPGSWRTFAFYAVLLRSVDAVVLVDCGMDDPGPLNAGIEPVLGDRGLIRPLEGGSRIDVLLARHGLTVSNVDIVAFTHLHADHSFNAPLFPDARYLLSAEGWRRHLAQRESGSGVVCDPFFPDAAVQEVLAASHGSRLLLPENDGSPLDGLIVRHLGGHTHDSTGYVVDTEVGPVVIPGDVVWSADNLEFDVPVGSYVDLDECRAALAWTRALGGTALPAHEIALMTVHPDGRVAGPRG